MKSVRNLAMLAILAIVATLPAAEPWEGEDEFSNSVESSAKWTSLSKSSNRNYQYVFGGQLRCYFVNEESDFAWIWGSGINKTKIHRIPSAANWTVAAEVTVPRTAPTNNTISRCKAGFAIVSWPPSRVLLVKVRKYFYESTNDFKLDIDLDFSPKKSGSEVRVAAHEKYRIRFIHDALNQLDNFVVEGVTGGIPTEIYNTSFPTQLNATPTVALATVVSGKPNWPFNNTTLGLDNWQVSASDPGPIDLPSKNGTSRGVSYSVVVTNLDLVSQKLQGQVTINIGAASATIPISGSIDRKGNFILKAAGVGADQGFRCTLQYNRSLNSFVPEKNNVYAPGEKKIKF